MNASEKIDQLAVALSHVQDRIKDNPPKNAEGAKFGNKPLRYADLPTILNHIRKPLEEQGLVVLQYVQGDDLNTLLIHITGQFLLLGPYPLHGADDQKRGASITYGRRATLAALFLIAGDDADPDADGVQDSADLEPPATIPTSTGSEPTTQVRGMGDAEREEEGPAFGEGAATSSSQPDPHPGREHKLGPAGNEAYARQGVKQCRIAGCDYVYWPKGVRR